MNFKALRAFALVMKFGSITGAADKLRLSAPAVSRLIAQLEATTKLKLFDRDHRGLSPTEAGNIFMQEAQRILDDLDELPDVIRKIKSDTSQRLSLLTTPRLVPGLIVPALERMAERHPNVRCSLDIQSKWELERSLARNRYHLSVAILPTPANMLTVRPLYRIASELLLHEDHRLARKERVRAEDLRHERVVGFLPGQLLRRQVGDFFRNAGIDVNYCMEASNSAVAAELTRRNCGLSVIDGLVCAGVDMGGLKRIPLQPQIWTTAGLIYSSDKELNEPARQFIECVREVLIDYASRPANKKSIELFLEEASQGRSGKGGKGAFEKAVSDKGAPRRAAAGKDGPSKKGAARESSPVGAS